MRKPGAPVSSSFPDGYVEGLEVAKHLESCHFLNSYMNVKCIEKLKEWYYKFLYTYH